MTEHQDNDLPETPVELSPAGQRRREAMLLNLQSAVVRRRRVRRARRAAVLAAIPLLALASALVFIPGPPVPIAPVAEGDPAPGPVEDVSTPLKAQQAMASIVEIVTDDVTGMGIIQRSGTSSIHIERIDDDELVRTLAQMDRPSGLIRTKSEVRLTASVTDADLKRRSNDAS